MGIAEIGIDFGLPCSHVLLFSLFFFFFFCFFLLFFFIVVFFNAEGPRVRKHDNHNPCSHIP